MFNINSFHYPIKIKKIKFISTYIFIISISTLFHVPTIFAQSLLVSAACPTTNQVQNVLYYSTPPSPGQNPNRQISVPMNKANPAMKPYWDFRYVNTVVEQPLAQYANHLLYSGINATTSASNFKGWGTAASIADSSGSLAQFKCVDGYLAASVMVNGWDSIPVPPGTFGGPVGTWTYLFTNNGTGSSTAPTPWNSNQSGNLMLQGMFMQPFRYSADSVQGGEVNFNVFLAKKNQPNITLNYVISVYRSNGNLTENPNPQQDPSNSNGYFISTLIKNGTQYVTASPYSNVASTMRSNTLNIENWPYFYRVNITYNNLLSALTTIGDPDLGNKPEDWMVTSVAVQTEITGSYQQSVGSSVRAFEVYFSNNAL